MDMIQKKQVLFSLGPLAEKSLFAIMENRFFAIFYIGL